MTDPYRTPWPSPDPDPEPPDHDDLDVLWAAIGLAGLAGWGIAGILGGLPWLGGALLVAAAVGVVRVAE